MAVYRCINGSLALDHKVYKLTETYRNCKNSLTPALAAFGFLQEPTIPLISHNLPMFVADTPFLSCDGIACHEVDSVSGL